MDAFVIHLTQRCFSELARKVQEVVIDFNIVHNMYCVSLMFTTKTKIRRCRQESLEFTQIFPKGSFNPFILKTMMT